MSGWLLILALLVLGGVLSTLGDRLGSKVGKARLSLFNLRPRDTAVLITVLTGSLISAMSLGLMLLVSQQLRVGLFQLDQIQARLRESRSALQSSQTELRHSRDELERARRTRMEAERSRDKALTSQRHARGQLKDAEQRVDHLRQELQPLQRQRVRLEQERDRLSRDVRGRDAEIRRTEAELASVRSRIASGEKELKSLEGNVIALRRGDVVIASGQPLATAKVAGQRPGQAQDVINALLRQANASAFQLLLPGQAPNRQILLVPRDDISRLAGLLAQPGSWVVSIRSAANVVRGEQRVLGFPDLRPNRIVVRLGEVMARTALEPDVRTPAEVRSRLNLLLAAAYAKAQRQGTLVDGLQFDPNQFNSLGRDLSERPRGQAALLEAIARQDAETPDPIVVELRWQRGDLNSPARSL